MWSMVHVWWRTYRARECFGAGPIQRQICKIRTEKLRRYLELCFLDSKIWSLLSRSSSCQRHFKDFFVSNGMRVITAIFTLQILKGTLMSRIKIGHQYFQSLHIHIIRYRNGRNILFHSRSKELQIWWKPINLLVVKRVVKRGKN